VAGPTIRCYLDGQLVHDVKTPTLRSLHASATRVKSTGELMIKIVNASPQELETDLRVDGVSKLASPARAIVLTSSKPTDENSLDHPTRVAPADCNLEVAGSSIRHTFPGNSVTVVRLRAE
jgi:alpha-L-arabinofuranosidase